ncbi:endonuclease domain-containing protein [Sphingorhabdus contaminans]|uniref:endonuclease domain-containing protein n=1 Tax=Sphingorhabdus contaminans TaxID=1343899 RepID=UPI003D27D350
MLKDIAPKPASGSVARARKLRKEMTLPEVLLWRLLRGQPQGVKFRRQHPSSSIGMDFYCSDARLVFEVDGIVHDMGDNPERDLNRDAWLRSRGIETVRIPAADVLKDVNAVADGILRLALSRLPLHHPARAGRSPSPRQARGRFEKDL